MASEAGNSVLRAVVYGAAAGCAVVLVTPQMALGYAGPGAGISAIGTLLSIVSALFLALIGFVWYPVKRLLRRFKRGDPTRKAGSPVNE